SLGFLPTSSTDVNAGTTPPQEKPDDDDNHEAPAPLERTRPNRLFDFWPRALSRVRHLDLGEMEEGHTRRGGAVRARGRATDRVRDVCGDRARGEPAVSGITENRTKLAARALLDLATRMESQAERDEDADLRRVYLADACKCRGAASTWERDGEKAALE